MTRDAHDVWVITDWAEFLINGWDMEVNLNEYKSKDEFNHFVKTDATENHVDYNGIKEEPSEWIINEIKTALAEAKEFGGDTNAIMKKVPPLVM